MPFTLLVFCFILYVQIMSSFFAFVCAVFLLVPYIIVLIFSYPLSIKFTSHVSNCVVKKIAPKLFAVFSFFNTIQFRGYSDNKDKLPEQFFLISNHQGLIDIPVYMNFLRNYDLRFVAKKELGRHIPLVSEMLRSQKHCLVPRTGSPAVAMKTLEKFGRQVIAEKQIPVLFPEGTRSRDGSVGKFYAAGFRKLSDITGLPIVACALDGGWKFGKLNKIMTDLQRSVYRVKILKIYDPPQNKEEQVKILDESRELIVKQLEEWRAGN